MWIIIAEGRLVLNLNGTWDEDDTMAYCYETKAGALSKVRSLLRKGFKGTLEVRLVY